MYSVRDGELEWNHIDLGVVNCDEMSLAGPRGAGRNSLMSALDTVLYTTTLIRNYLDWDSIML